MQKDGWVLLDVRVDGNYNFEHIKDSVSIPLYRPVQGRSLFDNAKRLAMASMAMKATGTFQLAPHARLAVASGACVSNPTRHAF